MSNYIFKLEFKALLKTLSLWLLILCGFFIISILIYPTYIEYKDSIIPLLKNSPQFTLGIENNNLENLFTPVGYYCFIFKFIMIFSAIEAAIFGAKIVTNDNKNTFLYTKPIKRNTILNSKMLAVLLCLVITNVVYQITSCVVMFFLTQVDYKALFLINLGLLFFQITFAAIIMMISSFIKNERIISITSYVSIGAFYILSILENLLDNALLRYINPFSYFKPSDILQNGYYNKSFIIASVFIIAFMINFSYIHNNELEM